MKLLYPRYCVLDVQSQRVVACLRLQDEDGPAHKEVRTFGSDIAEVVVLSNWLAGHGVTHVAIRQDAESWKSLYQALQQAFTVMLIDPGHATEVKDIQRIADLLAYGLMQVQVVTPTAAQEAPPSSRRRRLVLVAALFTVLLAVYGVWKTGYRAVPLSPPAPASLSSVRWQQLQLYSQQPAGQPFTLPLPALERTPEKLPVEVLLEPSMATDNWLQFDRERLQMRGIAPVTAAGQTYQLIVRARTEHGSESRLLVSLAITEQLPPLPTATHEPPPPPPPSPQPQNPDPPSDTPGRMKLWHSW